MANVVAREFIHSSYVRLGKYGDAVIVKTHNHFDDGSHAPGLDIWKNPKRKFYISKPHIKHQFKKELEYLANLDQYEVENYRLEEELFKVLNGYYSKKRMGLSSICDDPRVYGADIHIETLINHRYKVNFNKYIEGGGKPYPITTGFFDIETDVVSGNGTEPIIISVTHENKVYTAFTEAFFVIRDYDGNRRQGNIEELSKLSQEVLKEYIDKHKFEFEYHVGKRPIDIIKWIFSKIHMNKTDFLGVWNEDFDIPMIIKAIEEAGATLNSIFCPPEVPQNLRHTEYRRDNKEVAHITLKWHWLTCTSHTQFVDSMCLYSILRTVKGREPGGYSLDNILRKNKISDGKLKFKDDPSSANLTGLDWHRYMQKYRTYEYIVYNQFDCMSIQMMEWKNHDLEAMVNLGGVTQLSKWPRQTRKVADDLFFFCLDRGRVTASAGTNMTTEFDELIGKTGGAVLPPGRTRSCGLKILSDLPHIETMLRAYVSDVDFAGLYPNIGSALNISKETKLFTALEIDGFDRVQSQRYFSLLASPRENAVYLAKYYGLPNYQEFDTLYKQSRMQV